MPEYLVIALWSNDRGPFAASYVTATPEEAIQAARDEYEPETDATLEIAGVVTLEDGRMVVVA